MIKRLIAWAFFKTCDEISVMKVVDRLFTSWVLSTPMNKKEKIISFINMTLGIVQERMPMYNVAIAEARSEVVAILNNMSVSEPRMLCPRCKSLIKIPCIGDKRTLVWAVIGNRMRSLSFNCTKCGYTKSLGITSTF